MKQNTQAFNWMGAKDRVRTLSTVSTISLIVLMLVYLAMSIWSSNRMAQQTEIISGHPFEVVASVGKLQTHVSEMRIRMERLTTHRSGRDLGLVRRAMNSIYQEMEEPLEQVDSLYLGSPEDIADLKSTLARLREAQDECLEYAAMPDMGLDQIERYQSQRLYPLYAQAGDQLDRMLQSAQSKKVQYGEMSETLRKNTLTGSLALMALMIVALFLSQYALRRQSRELTTRSQLFDNLSTSIDDAFLIRNLLTGEVYYVGLNIERVLGYPVQKLEDVYQGFQPGDAREIREAIQQGGGTNLVNRVVKYKLPSGERRWISVRVYRAEHIESPLVISVFSDCTDEVNSRQALQDAMLNAERANTAKSEFLSRMSHEIRTPLNAIIGMTTIAAASVNSPQKVEDCLAKINFSSKHLLMLINDVLDMSKIESNKMSLQKEPFDLSQVVNSFASPTYAQAKAKGVAFRTVLEGFEGQTQYVGDPLRLSQVLLNLGSNAVKFTPPGGAVTLTVSRIAAKRSTDTLRFVVRDTGIGMSQEALGRIFRPFEQADASIASRFGGTGLGMSITQNLVALMDGHIEIQSEPGAGTACIVDIPLLRDQEAKAQPDFASMGLRALVVDDEQSTCVETAALLEKIRIQAQWVLTGAQAVSRVAEAQRSGSAFDFCLIDWKIPDMDGIEVTRRIRASVGPGLPIIMISSYDCSEIEEEARAAGANAFLPKPLYRSSVYEAVKSAVGEHKAQAAPVEPGQLKGRRLLVAEDNELNREIVTELLCMNGVEVECAADGREALSRFQQAAPGYFDAILMDVQMPVMNGYEAAQRIRASGHPDGAGIPIIATTANAFSDDISAALAAGMNAHVSKPIDLEQLCRVLLEELSRR